jgi:hypothetical protein
MSILRKPLSEVTEADLEALIEAEARETGELEFKGTLPFKPTKGQPETADRWIEKGDRVGDMARDEILAEIVAFANAEGGTLVLGLHETKDEPRRAERLEALPNCEGLARRLLDATEDVIEPRLPLITVQALASEATGAGYVLLRVGKSLAGPHRLRSTRDFYVRRGERAAKMDVREIKDLTLELARTGDRIDALFQERRLAAEQLWNGIADGREGNTGPFIVRATAFPLAPLNVPAVTSRRDLWWGGSAFDLILNGQEQTGNYPSREFNSFPRPRLRSFASSPDVRDGGVHRMLRGDGLVEFVLAHPRRTVQHDTEGSLIYAGWVMQLVAGVLCQVQWLRQNLAMDDAPFGLEVEARGEKSISLLLGGNRFESSSGRITSRDPSILPRLQIGAIDDFDALLQALLLDLSNLAGMHWDLSCSAPWARILPTS